jgi:hypothetical protein
VNEFTESAFVVGLFDDPEGLLRAAEKARDARWKRWDCHTPHPVHGLEKAMGLAPSLIPVLVLFAGFSGAAFAKTMQWWMSARDFPLVVGGKPMFSLPAFVPVTFELFVLFGALTGFASLLLACRLGKWRSPLHEAGAMREVTSDRFAICFDVSDEEFGEDRARGLLTETGCGDIRVVRETQA